MDRRIWAVWAVVTHWPLLSCVAGPMAICGGSMTFSCTVLPELLRRPPRPPRLEVDNVAEMALLPLAT